MAGKIRWPDEGDGGRRAGRGALFLEDLKMMKRDNRLARATCFVLAGVGLSAAAGCGGDGLDRHEVSGSVTFAGTPVQAGQLSFEPASDLGLIAPSGYAKVENGSYKIERDVGPIAGQYTFRVSGFDLARMRVIEGEGADVPMLFPEYVLQVDIPPPEGRLDIEVPKRPSRR
jgi:hypothetical protein